MCKNTTSTIDASQAQRVYGGDVWVSVPIGGQLWRRGSAHYMFTLLIGYARILRIESRAAPLSVASGDTNMSNRDQNIY